MSRTGAPKVIVNIANALDKSIYEVTIYNVNSFERQLDGEVDKDIRLTEYHPIISKGKASDNLLVKYLFKFHKLIIKLVWINCLKFLNLETFYIIPVLFFQL